MKEEHIAIRDLGIHGEGIGSLDGLTLFVPGMLPKEEGQVKIVERKKNYAVGKLSSLSQIAEDRQEPLCPLFGKCGGCQLLHLKYEAQVELKGRRVKEALDRIGKIEGYKIFPCQPSKEPLFYRNKIQLPVDGAKIGLYAAKSHDIIPVEKCYIHNENGDTVYRLIREEIQKNPHLGLRHVWLRSSRKTKEVLVALIVRGKVGEELRSLAKRIFAHPLVVGVLGGSHDRVDNVLRPDSLHLLCGEEVLEEELLGVEVEISMESFFQVNSSQAEAIYEKASLLADLQKGASVLDAYCGLGLFAIFLAKKGAKVTGIEMVEKAIEDAKKNAIRNQVEALFLCGKVEDLIRELPPYDVVFLNPPRKGCEKIVIDTVSRQAPDKIIYTSCDPATLARDLALFQERGYKTVEVHPFDLFPQTMHVETVALLCKNNLK
ncbi:MAG: 23S rRNA (uracil(1939)-C(5))-methyltransferase RlmD [Verrucomicrobia bacterium]|nr:23S rRNA (uracil(1939)-C(5))-methyltransferase RlmD [Verrucomicrobiota bacterium]